MEMAVDGLQCARCGRLIDSQAKLCVYCNANPSTGEKLDLRPLLDEQFPRKKQLGPGEKIVQYTRERQQIAIALVVILVVLALAGLHHFVSLRNQQTVSDVPPVPLADVADLSDQRTQNEVAPLPKVGYQYDGSPASAERMLVEPGAVAPPPPVVALPPGAQPAPQQLPPLRGATGIRAPQTATH